MADHAVSEVLGHASITIIVRRSGMSSARVAPKLAPNGREHLIRRNLQGVCLPAYTTVTSRNDPRWCALLGSSERCRAAKIRPAYPERPFGLLRG